MPTSQTRSFKAVFAPLLALLSLVLLTTLPRVDASALTTTINANERTCFYALVDKVGEKVSPSILLSESSPVDSS